MTALAGVTLVTMGLLSLVLLLGDARRLEVTFASPSGGEPVAATVREITLTFSREPRREAIEAALRFEPAIDGTVRWRGNSVVFTPLAPLREGPHTLTLPAGKYGRASEPLEDHYVLRFEVRAPGVAMVVRGRPHESLIVTRDEAETLSLVSAPRIVDFAIAPDGADIAVVTAGEDGRGSLWLVSSSGGEPRPLGQAPAINIGGVTWSPDAAALLVIRRDTLPSGEEGVPRAWLMRRDGTYVAPIDPDGNPSLNASWSPDGQKLGYVSPSDARLAVLNLTTEEIADLGQPRGGAPAWSADSAMVVFESVAAASSSNPPQPIRIRSIDGSFDRTIGVAGEIRLAPRFWDDETVASLRRGIGPGARGTDLVFESIRDGRLVRAISLSEAGSDLILDWDLDPGRTRVVYTARTAAGYTTMTLDLETGDRTQLVVGGDLARWAP